MVHWPRLHYIKGNKVQYRLLWIFHEVVNFLSRRPAFFDRIVTCPNPSDGVRKGAALLRAHDVLLLAVAIGSKGERFWWSLQN